MAQKIAGKIALLPISLAGKNGEIIIVREGVQTDADSVRDHIADRSGTGSGVGNDDYLIQEFSRQVDDEHVTVLIAVKVGSINMD